jgi:O-antigen/teichoic acid export membrane protein
MLATRVVNVVTGGVVSVVISRSLGPLGRGEYGVIASLVAMGLVVGHLSIESALVRNFSSGVGAPTLRGAALLVGLLLGTFAGIGVCAAGAALHLVEPKNYAAMLVAACSIPPAMCGLFIRALQVMGGRFGQSNLSSLAGGLSQVAFLAILAVRHDLSVTNVMVAALVSTVLATTVSLINLAPVRVPNRRFIVDLAVMGAHFHVGTSSFYLLLKVDVLIAAWLVDTRLVGLYTLSVALAEAVSLIGDTLAQLSIPSVVAGDASAPYRVACTAAWRCVLISFGAAACAALGGAFLISPLFGADYQGSVVPFLALLPGLAFLTGVKVLLNALYRARRVAFHNSLLFAGLLGNVILNLVLIPAIGIVGASIASTIVYSAMACIAYREVLSLANSGEGALT